MNQREFFSSLNPHPSSLPKMAPFASMGASGAFPRAKRPRPEVEGQGRCAAAGGEAAERGGVYFRSNDRST